MGTLGIDRLDQLLRGASQIKVTVVGDLMLDVYLSGMVHRISPEAPVPVVQVVDERTALGGAANVAANVLRVGASCDVIGFVGRDIPGEQLRRGIETLEGGRVRAMLVDTPKRPTTTKTRVMARKQQVVRFDRESDADLPHDACEQLRAQIRDSLRDSDVLVLEDYNKGVLAPDVIAAALKAAREADVPVIVDPKFRNIFEYQRATVFKPNAMELTSALGVPIEPDNDDWLEEARRRFDCDHLLVTLGEAGMVVRSRSGETSRVPAVAREVYDVSGAGDTVTAFVAVALAAGAGVHEAALVANFAAAIEVGKPGVATVPPEELRGMVSRHYEESVFPIER